MPIQTRTSVVRHVPGKYETVEVDLDDPRQDEVTVKLAASGLCHSDHGPSVRQADPAGPGSGIQGRVARGISAPGYPTLQTASYVGQFDRHRPGTPLDNQPTRSGSRRS